MSRDTGDRNTKDPTIITASTTLHGEVVSSSPVIVHGTVKGNCEIDNLLRVESSGTWVGNIRTASAIINGKVEGDVVVDAKLEVGATARIHGNVTARRLAVASGAVIEGDMRMSESGNSGLALEAQAANT